MYEFKWSYIGATQQEAFSRFEAAMRGCASRGYSPISRCWRQSGMVGRLTGHPAWTLIVTWQFDQFGRADLPSWGDLELFR